MGWYWGTDVVTAYIRPQRYTKEFVDQQKCFSLSFFDGHKKELGVLGSVSGRDANKIKDVDFHITYLEDVPTFEEAHLVFIVEKLYEDTIKPECFLDRSLDTRWYPDKDYHTMYVAKIKSIYKPFLYKFFFYLHIIYGDKNDFRNNIFSFNIFSCLIYSNQINGI